MEDNARKVEVYARQDGRYDWRRIAVVNGQVVATSGGQGFAKHSAVMESASRENPGVPIVDLTDEPALG